MSGDQPEPEAVEEQEAAGEPRQMSDRTAKAILAVIGLGVMWGIVVAFPWVAYVLVGILACRAWDKARAWRTGRAEEEPSEEDESVAEVDIVALLQQLDRSVLLTELRDDLGVADTKAVKALLAEAGVRWREGVRTPAGNGPGVHQDDIPAPSPVDDGSPEECCSCRSAANANANNAHEGASGEGLRVETIGQAGAVIRDPADAVRYHRVEG